MDIATLQFLSSKVAYGSALSKGHPQFPVDGPDMGLFWTVTQPGPVRDVSLWSIFSSALLAHCSGLSKVQLDKE